MENYNLIIAGVIGSTITLFLTAIIDFIKEKYRTKIEMQKLVFQRKTDAVERAISWYQEAIDCYRMMQTACDTLEEEYNPTTYNRLEASFAQAGRLYANTSKQYIYITILVISRANTIFNIRGSISTLQ